MKESRKMLKILDSGYEDGRDCLPGHIAGVLGNNERSEFETATIPLLLWDCRQDHNRVELLWGSRNSSL